MHAICRIASGWGIAHAHAPTGNAKFLRGPVDEGTGIVNEICTVIRQPEIGSSPAGPHPRR